MGRKRGRKPRKDNENYRKGPKGEKERVTEKTKDYITFNIAIR